jgi:hypothetical protein
LIEYLGPHSRPDASNTEQFWNPLVALRKDAVLEWIPSWTEQAELDFAPYRDLMHLVYEIDRLARESWDVGRKARQDARDRSPEEQKAISLETARVEEQKGRASLDATWKLLASDAPRIFHVFAGVEVEHPAPGTRPEALGRYASALELGLAEFRAGRHGPAHERFREAASAAPGMQRADLLAAACLALQGRPLQAARDLLSADAAQLEGRSSSRWYAWPLIEQTFREMEAAPDEARALGQELAGLFPPESGRRERPARREWWSSRDDRVRHARPEGDAVVEANAWRLWWRSARYDLEARAGRFAWRRERRGG